MAGFTCDHCGKNLVLRLTEDDRATAIEPYYSVMWYGNLGSGKGIMPKTLMMKRFKFCPECFSVLETTLSDFGCKSKED